MTLLISTLFFLAIAVWLGIVVQHDTGFVMVSYGHWSMQTTLWAALIAIIILFIIAYWLFRFLGSATRASAHLSGWFKHRRKTRARRLAQRGYYDVLAGRWQPATHWLSKAIKHHPSPLLATLGLAYSAQSDITARDKFLAQAKSMAGKKIFLYHVTAARMLMQSNHWDRAKTELQAAHTLQPKSVLTLSLLSDVLCTLNKWRALYTLLPLLKKHGALSETAYNALEEKTLHALILESDNAPQLLALWDSFSRHQQKNPRLLAQHIKQLLSLNDRLSAMERLKHAIKRHPTAELATLLADCDKADVLKYYDALTQKLESNHPDANTAMALAHLSLKAGFIGKAKAYATQSISLSPSPDAYLILGKAEEALGESDAASISYKHGLQL